MISIDRLLYILAFVIGVVVHEYAHGYAAFRLGDPTAKLSGRLTLNPLAHIDPIGLLTLIVFRFGWAKGVPVDSRYFKNKKRDMIIVSSAGIVTNVILAVIASLFFKIIPNNYILLNQFLFNLSMANLMLGIFNLLPFPPLDGSKILISLLPLKTQMNFYRYEKYLYIILVILIFTGIVSDVISPILIYCLEALYF